MSAPFHKIGMYLICGGLLLTWIDPPAGFTGYVLIVGLILCFAYLDILLAKRNRQTGNDPKVVSMGAFRAQNQRSSGPSPGGRERRVLRPAYTSAYYAEVDALLQILRGEGLNPMMVTQNRSGSRSSPIYMIMLSEKELRRAKPMIDLYVMQSAKTPS